MVISGKEQIYNLFADLCAFIVRAHTKNYLVRYSCISAEEKSRIEDKIQNETPLSLNMEGHFMPIRDSQLTEEFVTKLVTFAGRLMVADDKNCIMRLIQAFDESLQVLISEEIDSITEISNIKQLNSNNYENGIELLPRCKCLWARKSRQSFSYRRLDNYLFNVMVIEGEKTYEDIKDNHIFIPQGFFKKFDETGQLKVAASPLSATPNFDLHFHKSRDLKVFSLDYHDDEIQAYNEMVWAKIVAAGKEGAELVVFPEMLGNKEMEGYVSEKLKALSEEERESIPPMIILPSFFDDMTNYCPILDKNGNVLARQYKHNPYVMFSENGEYMEKIFGSSIIEIFHYEGIGRFAVLICKDFLTTRYMERIMRDFMLTMILVPSYSTGAFDFKMSLDLCAHDYCNVVWINSCAAMIPGKEDNFAYIGYTRKRINRYQEESEAHSKMIPCPGLMTGECKKDCLYFDSFGAV